MVITTSADESVANVVFNESIKNVKTKRTRRGWGNSGKGNGSQKNIKLSVLGNNVNVRSGLGGGLLAAIHTDFSPLLISIGEEETDVLVTQIENCSTENQSH